MGVSKEVCELPSIGARIGTLGARQASLLHTIVVPPSAKVTTEKLDVDEVIRLLYVVEVDVGVV